MKSFQQFRQKANSVKIASHDKPIFKSVPATGIRGDQPASDYLRKAATPGGLVKPFTPKNPFGV
tara:strand:+ start:995 stop:1186 length:192 start_codon:yes stop_codon:yes gene_type:complete